MDYARPDRMKSRDAARPPGQIPLSANSQLRRNENPSFKKARAPNRDRRSS